MFNYERGKGDWYYLFFPEVDSIKEIEFKVPKCCKLDMLYVPTDCGQPMYVCEKCMKSEEVD